jgi:hypothetical protein
MRNLKRREIGKTTTVSANFLSVSFCFFCACAPCSVLYMQEIVEKRGDCAPIQVVLVYL